jgi:NADPH:quinone reductase-like Zn-dependent oxidoreductase
MASEKSKILVVGATGYLGRHVVAASARLGHPTFALVRDMAPSDAAKAALLQSFQDTGVTLLEGDLGDQASLVSAVKAADVVISTVGVRQIADQTRLIDAIKEAGNVKVCRSEISLAVCSCVRIQFKISNLFFLRWIEDTIHISHPKNMKVPPKFQLKFREIQKQKNQVINH